MQFAQIEVTDRACPLVIGNGNHIYYDIPICIFT